MPLFSRRCEQFVDATQPILTYAKSVSIRRKRVFVMTGNVDKYAVEGRVADSNNIDARENAVIYTRIP